MKPNDVKKLLLSKIKEVSDKPELYSINPKTDFTRSRKLSFMDVVSCVIGMGGDTLYKEITDHFGYSTTIATTSAFIQQRSKIKAEAFEDIFRNFSTQSLCGNKLRILAIDGTDLHIPTNLDDADSLYLGNSVQKSYNLLHLNALYDIDQNIYLDAIIQKSRKSNEHKALTEMVDRSDIEQALVIADRGYESYNNMAHIQEKGWKFLIRVKEGKYGICDKLVLPSTDCFDFKVKLSLTRKQTNEAKKLFHEPNRYRFIPTNTNFDYLPPRSSHSDPLMFYTLSFRVVRFKITDDSYETVVTNLDEETHSPERIKELYAMRWGIETSFRNLKYTVGLAKFHTKKVMCVEQEIFARLIMYNFVEMITSHVVINGKPKQYTYKTNFSVAVHVCRAFFKGKNTSPYVETTIANNTIPIRPGRQSPRKTTNRTFAGFQYRVA